MGQLVKWKARFPPPSPEFQLPPGTPTLWGADSWPQAPSPARPSSRDHSAPPRSAPQPSQPQTWLCMAVVLSRASLPPILAPQLLAGTQPRPSITAPPAQPRGSSSNHTSAPGSLSTPAPQHTPCLPVAPQPCTDLRKCTSEISCRQSQQKRQPQTVQFMRLQLPSLIFMMKALQRGQTLMSSASAGRGNEMRWDGGEAGQDSAGPPPHPVPGLQPIPWASG